MANPSATNRSPSCCLEPVVGIGAVEADDSAADRDRQVWHGADDRLRLREALRAGSRLRPRRASRRRRSWRSATAQARGAISSSFCGLNASTTSLGGGPASAKLRHGADALDRRAARANDDSCAERPRPPAAIRRGSRRPMLPQPTNHVGAGSCQQLRRIMLHHACRSARRRSPRRATCRPTGRTGTPGRSARTPRPQLRRWLRPARG